ncbi:MAG: sugar transferase [Actinobacteria bacterium]|nr:sugar transferase [Actinomycetota bacterium]
MARGRFIVLSIVLDAMLVNAGIVGAFFLRFGGHLPTFNFAPYVALSPLITVLYLGAGYIFGLYEPERTEGTWELGRAVFQAVTLGTVLTVAVAFFAGPGFFSFSRLVILIAWVAQFLLLVGWRALLLRFTSVIWPEQRILIVGTTELAAELARELEERAGWGYRVVGLVSRAEEGESAPSDFRVLGEAAEVTGIIAREQIDRVIIASPVALRELIEDMALSNESDVRVEVIPELYEIFIGTVDSTVSDIPLMELTRPAAPGWYRSSKRVLDILASATVLVVLSPLLLLVALAILLTMGWPVFFRQERVGRNGRTFDVVKFRTMVNNAEALSGPVLAEEADPRVTPLGRFLRASRIDEIPQLANILLGQMSWVGPRPERPFFVEQYVKEIPGYRERFKVKPGVTGLAQVSGGYATTPERKLKFDLIYMYHQNLLMDIQILVETVRVVLTGHGAR